MKNASRKKKYPGKKSLLELANYLVKTNINVDPPLASPQDYFDDPM